MASQEAQDASEPRAPMSRRFVLGTVAGAGAAGVVGAVSGVTAIRALASSGHEANPATMTGNPAPVAAPAGSAPMVVYVRDARSGLIEVLSATSQARVKDPALVARLARMI